jgi:hypothetical protein
MVEPLGGFVLVYVATPLEVCEARDRKGLYARARAGLLHGFTGISDPYESPSDAELLVDTTGTTPSQAAEAILLYLEREGFIDARRPAQASSPAPALARVAQRLLHENAVSGRAIEASPSRTC